MTKLDANAIKEDFREWSGGFPPESPEQITVYVDYAAPADTDDTEIRKMLLAWMAEGTD